MNKTKTNILMILDSKKKEKKWNYHKAARILHCQNLNDRQEEENGGQTDRQTCHTELTKSETTKNAMAKREREKKIQPNHRCIA